VITVRESIAIFAAAYLIGTGTIVLSVLITDPAALDQIKYFIAGPAAVLIPISYILYREHNGGDQS
jgi:hypothetical protein